MEHRFCERLIFAKLFDAINRFNDEREILLDVPKYDFNGQLKYILEEPKLMPKGTKVICTATYDNSEYNLASER